MKSPEDLDYFKMSKLVEQLNGKRILLPLQREPQRMALMIEEKNDEVKEALR